MKVFFLKRESTGGKERERERERERDSFVSGLNQRLTEICFDGSKLFSMGNM